MHRRPPGDVDHSRRPFGPPGKLAQLDDGGARGRLDDPIMRSRSRTLAGLLPAALLVIAVGACGGSGPGGTGGPAATATPAATSAGPAAIASPGAGTGALGGIDLGSILGTNLQPPPTTWTRASDPAAPFSYEVPAAWTGRLVLPWSDGSATIGTVLLAGPDPSKMGTDFSVPGVAIGISANPNGMSARAAVEAEQTFAGTCTGGEVQEATEAGANAAFRLYERCGGGGAYVVVLAIVPADGKGMIEVLFQGVEANELGYLERIVGSVRAETSQATPVPAATGTGSVSGDTYTISMDTCQNQHGQGVSAGLIRNDDSLVHAFRIVVAFSDPNGVFLNDTGWTTSDLGPGVTATWQATVPSGLPAVSVSCRITSVQVVR